MLMTYDKSRLKSSTSKASAGGALFHFQHGQWALIGRYITVLVIICNDNFMPKGKGNIMSDDIMSLIT